MLKNEIIYERDIDHNQTQVVDWVIGAFIMISRAAYEKTSGLDERFFMYAEDVDFCYRIRKVGYEIAYFPQTKIEYKGTRAARSIIQYQKIFLKSHLLLWQKHGFLKARLKTANVCLVRNN